MMFLGKSVQGITIAFALTILCVPFPGWAQQPAKVPQIGVLLNAPRSATVELSLAELLRGLRELGYVEGKSLHIEWRFTEGRAERLAPMVAELVALKVSVIVASPGNAARAALTATSSIPIVMTAIADPENFVRNLAKPEANITGIAQNLAETSTKYVELLRSLLPKLRRVSVIVNGSASHQAILDQIRASAKASSVSVSSLTATNAVELDRALKAVVSNRSDAFIVAADPAISVLTAQMVKFAEEHRLPTMFGSSGFVERGGLMAYGVAPPALYYRAATYIDKLLKGAKISELPVEFPTKIDLTINMKTAKAIGLVIPKELLLRAERVIE